MRHYHEGTKPQGNPVEIPAYAGMTGNRRGAGMRKTFTFTVIPANAGISQSLPNTSAGIPLLIPQSARVTMYSMRYLACGSDGPYETHRQMPGNNVSPRPGPIP